MSKRGIKHTIGDAVVTTQPTYEDPIMGTFVWVTDDGAVEVPAHMVDSGEINRILDMAGQYARSGKRPGDVGIKVTTYGAPYIAPMFRAEHYSGDAKQAMYRALMSRWDLARTITGYDYPLIQVDLDPEAVANTRTRRKVLVTS